MISRQQQHLANFYLLLTAATMMLCVQVSIAQTYTPESLHTGPYWSPDGEKLAFSAAYDESYDVYVVDVWGLSTERITDHPSNNLYPSWSPDGNDIAYFSDRESTIPPHPPDTIIYKVRGLYETYARDGYKPSWSPDGKTIAAHLRSERGNYEIYIMNSKGRDRRPLTWTLATNVHPRFSPDGKKIVFVTDRDDVPEIYVMDAGGGNQIRLTHSPAYDIDPVWSPDGTRIAFSSNMTGFFDIYVMDAAGNSKQKLTKSLFYDISPVWSPDGTRILFSSNRHGQFDLFVMDADGSNLQRLTRNESHEYYGSWSPDGLRIAYLSIEEGGDPHLYVMSTDGKQQRKLTR